MNTKNIILALTLISTGAIEPTMAATPLRSARIKQADSAFKTFKKDMKCMFSRTKKCSPEQRRRIKRKGLALIGALAVLGLGITAGVLGWKEYKERNKTNDEDPHGGMSGYEEGGMSAWYAALDDEYKKEEEDRIAPYKDILDEKKVTPEIRKHVFYQAVLDLIVPLYGQEITLENSLFVIQWLQDDMKGDESSGPISEPVIDAAIAIIARKNDPTATDKLLKEKFINYKVAKLVSRPLGF